MLYPFSKCNDIIDQNENKTRGATIAKPYSQAFGASFQKKFWRANIGTQIKAMVVEKPFRYFVTFAMGLK